MRKPPAPGKTLMTFCPIKSSFASSASSVSRPCAHAASCFVLAPAFLKLRPHPRRHGSLDDEDLGFSAGASACRRVRVRPDVFAAGRAGLTFQRARVMHSAHVLPTRFVFGFTKSSGTFFTTWHELHLCVSPSKPSSVGVGASSSLDESTVRFGRFAGGPSASAGRFSSWSRFYECKRSLCERRSTPNATRAEPEIYAGEPEAYTDGGRKTNAAGRHREENHPSPRRAGALRHRRDLHASLPKPNLEARADRDAAVDGQRVARDVARRRVQREVSH